MAAGEGFDVLHRLPSLQFFLACASPESSRDATMRRLECRTHLTKRRRLRALKTRADYSDGMPSATGGYVSALRESSSLGGIQALRCPHCVADKVKDTGRLTACRDLWLISDCGRKYPIREGIPVMMLEEWESAAAGTEAGDERLA